MTLAVSLVVDVALGPGVAILAAAGVALWFSWWWFAIPLLARRASDDD